MRKFLTIACVLSMTGALAACETAQNEIEVYEARQAAERAEAKADAAMREMRTKNLRDQRAYDASQRK